MKRKPIVTSFHFKKRFITGGKLPTGRQKGDNEDKSAGEARVGERREAESGFSGYRCKNIF